MMKRALLVVFAALLLSPLAHAQTDMTQGGVWRDVTRENHPLAKSLVAVNQISHIQNHHGNGFVYGPGGCFVITNYHIGVGNPPSSDGEANWVFKTRSEFVDNVRKHRVDVRADLDPMTGQFRKQLHGRVIGYGIFSQREHKTRNQAQEDVMVLKLYDSKAGKPVCFPELAVQRAESYGMLSSGTVEPMGSIHLFKTGENSASVFLSSKPCKSLPVLHAGALVSDCPSRGGASGSILFEDRNGRPVLRAMISGTGTSTSRVEKLEPGTEFTMGPSLGHINHYLRRGIDYEYELGNTFAIERQTLTQWFAENVKVWAPIAEDNAARQCLLASTRAPCDEYLKAYANGEHVALARAKIADIERGARR